MDCVQDEKCRPFRQHLLAEMVSVLAVSLLVQCILVRAAHAQQPSINEQQVATLIEKLSADKFETRQNAENKLRELGPAIIVPLAKTLISGTVQTQASCLRLIRQMQITADDETTYRAALTLQAFTDLGVFDFRPAVSAIIDDWKDAKILENIRALESTGAEVHLVPDGYRVPLGLILPEITDDYASTDLPEVETKSRLTELDVTQTDKLKNEIARIQLASAEDLESEFIAKLSDLGSENNLAKNYGLGIPRLDIHFEGVVEEAVEVEPSAIISLVPAEGFAAISTLRSPGKRIDTVILNSRWQKAANGLELLKRLPAFEQVILREIEIDEGTLVFLSELGGLRSVTIDRCQFEIDNMLGFLRRKPEVEILLDPKAFLGVQSYLSVSHRNTACLISDVVADSAAARGGVRPGDTIIEFAGYPISNFASLRLVVSTLSPGDTAWLVVERAGEQVGMNVTLTEPSAR
ncbi:MAG TPA: PDZ domain-containing protein [Pirellulaceae bacterium]|nr:PDZ domain-containing protein [Pirellulaceae bacterium]HMO90628.1 PDZ domain-containing protein [Pirellulaceae bacterium]